jgi:hypothetical protein
LKFSGLFKIEAKRNKLNARLALAFNRLASTKSSIIIRTIPPNHTSLTVHMTNRNAAAAHLLVASPAELIDTFQIK